MKHKNENGILKMDLQFFADDEVAPAEIAPASDVITKAVESIQESNGTAPKKESVEEQPTTKTFTQEEVNRMMAKEKNEGKQSVFNKYGLTPEQLEAIAGIVNKEPAQPTVDPSYDLQMKTELLKARVGQELALAHVKPDNVDDMITIVTSKIDDVVNYDINQLKELVKDTKQRHQASFDVPSEIQKQISGTGNNIGGSNINTNTAKATNIGKRLAELQKSNSVVN